MSRALRSRQNRHETMVVINTEHFKHSWSPVCERNLSTTECSSQKRSKYLSHHLSVTPCFFLINTFTFCYANDVQYTNKHTYEENRVEQKTLQNTLIRAS